MLTGAGQQLLEQVNQKPEEYLPAEIRQHPSMISDKEKWQLFEAAAVHYQGEGRIVDAGIFLGGSTTCFGLGIEENSKKEEILARWPKPIVSFEQAIINPGMFKHFDRWELEVDGKAGDSFEPVLRDLLAPVIDKVDLRIGDITKAGWSPDDPIEILFLDVIKTPAINEFVLKTFFPRLIPGKSLVIQQDFFLDLLPYLKVGQEYFSDYFEFVAEIGPTAVFRLIRKIPAKMFKADPMTFLSVEEKLKLIDQAAMRAKSKDRQFMTALSKVHVVGENLGGRKGLQELQALVKKYPDQGPGVSKHRTVRKMYETALRRMSNTAGLLSMHQFLSDTLPAQAGEIPGYPTALERRFLFGLGRDYYRAKGQIVDIGSLLGATVVSLACGLQENSQVDSKNSRKINCFEVADHNNATLKFLQRRGVDETGESGGVSKILKSNLAPFDELTNLTIAPAKDWSLDKLDPVEILHIDRITNVAEFLAIYNATVPKLIAGQGVLILRNYFSDQLPHIKIIHESHADAFEFIGSNKSTAIFKAKKSVTTKALETSPLIALSPEQQAELISQAAERTWIPLYNILTHLAAIKTLATPKWQKKATEKMGQIEKMIDKAELSASEMAIIFRALKRAEGLINRLADPA